MLIIKRRMVDNIDNNEEGRFDHENTEDKLRQHHSYRAVMMGSVYEVLWQRFFKL